MEGKGLKSVLISALILGLVLEHIQVDAKSCCPSTTARNIYNTCRVPGTARPVCAKLSGCIIQEAKKCEPPYDHLSLFPHSDEVGVIDFCKLGCTSSVCNNINAFVGSEEVNDAVEHCNNACYRFCTKDVDIPTVVA
ncbi:hypothetical protein FJR56_24625 [Salmonella enterica]|nr:hypothetical protein FJR56_24625 [Salmonella enterica]